MAGSYRRWWYFGCFFLSVLLFIFFLFSFYFVFSLSFIVFSFLSHFYLCVFFHFGAYIERYTWSGEGFFPIKSMIVLCACALHYAAESSKFFGLNFLCWIKSLSSSEPWIITPSGGKSFDSPWMPSIFFSCTSFKFCLFRLYFVEVIVAVAGIVVVVVTVHDLYSFTWILYMQLMLDSIFFLQIHVYIHRLSFFLFTPALFNAMPIAFDTLLITYKDFGFWASGPKINETTITISLSQY